MWNNLSKMRIDMDTQLWVEHELDVLISESKTYPDQAFYRELKQLFIEQYQRIEQLQGELDGRMWNPSQW